MIFWELKVDDRDDKNFRMVENRPPIEEVYGTLPDWAIVQYMKIGLLDIGPLASDWKRKMGPVTIDFHLGEKILVPKEAAYKFVDVRRGVNGDDYAEMEVKKDQPFILQPDQFIIAETVEHMKVPDDMLARLEGKSSLARLGIVVHLTAGRFDPGWEGNPVLELKNNAHLPVILYGDWPICAFSFERLMAAPKKTYQQTGRYTKRRKDIHSLVQKDGRR